MKHFLQETNTLKRAFLYSLIAGSLMLATSCQKKEPEPVLKISTLATGLNNPIGMEIDKSGRIWVAEGGTGHNDGKVSVITGDGKKYEVIVNFESSLTDGGDPDGPTHLLFADGLLYILGANGKMYKADVSTLNEGNIPINASSLAVEDIGSFVLAYNFVNKTHETHPYNLTVGPNGAIYIADAAANAVLRRDRSGALSVLTEVPGIPNPTPVGPPQVESVPTGILYDGQNFLVTTLLGFPFPSGKALIYKISPTGATSVYQQAFTTLVDIAEGGSLGRLVLEHGTLGTMGFTPNTGRLVWANGNTATVLADGLNLPAGLKQANLHTWYVTSQGDGSVLKVTY